MARHLRGLWLAALLLCAPRPAASAADVDTAAVIIAGAVNAMDVSIQVAGDSAHLPDGIRLQYSQALERMKAYARETQAASSSPGLLRLARARGTDKLAGADLSDPGSIASAMRFLMNVQSSELHPQVERLLPADKAQAVEQAIDRFRHIDLVAAHERQLERLRHFEVKYGPGSPRLNGVETLVNFFAQRIPPFKPGRNGVSPYEVVAGYSTSYATLVEEEAKAMSTAEFGVRRYNWGFDTDPRSVPSAMKPRYWALGLAAASDRDGALRVPWVRRTRYGPFASWGDFKVAYLHGENKDWRVMVSRQLQLIPHLF